MTRITYLVTVKGITTEVRSFDEAIKAKMQGGSYVTRYTPIKKATPKPKKYRFSCVTR
jgi:hypothetical protein